MPTGEVLVPPNPPFASGARWWYWLGGRPALDFVNTKRERWRRNVECLVTPEDLDLWLVQARLLADDCGERADAGLLDEARELREAVDACVREACGRAAWGTGAGGPVSVIDSWLGEAALSARPRLVLDAAGRPSLADPALADTPRRALGALALDAARMLGSAAERDRIRICASDTCSARFFDRSPAGRRRWCSMTTCGNVAKARRHREKSRSGRG